MTEISLIPREGGVDRRSEVLIDVDVNVN